MIVTKTEAKHLFPLFISNGIEFKHKYIVNDPNIFIVSIIKDSANICNKLHESTKGLPCEHSVMKLLDMNFSEINGISAEYEESGDPDGIPEIDWIVANSSYPYRDNLRDGGVYDFIFNLGMLQSFIETNEPPTKELREQLERLEEQGFKYILFHQDC